MTDSVELPDGSGVAMASLPLPDDHWIYTREEVPEPLVTEETPTEVRQHLIDKIREAGKYAVRGATMCGKETDFDPDALIQNLVYALAGPQGGATYRYSTPEEKE